MWHVAIISPEVKIEEEERERPRRKIYHACEISMPHKRLRISIPYLSVEREFSLSLKSSSRQGIVP